MAKSNLPNCSQEGLLPHGAKTSLALRETAQQAQIAEIFALRPSIAEVEKAALWIAGDEDVLARSGQPQTVTVVQIVEIAATEEEQADRE